MNATDLLAFADVLLPGDELFPPASATGLSTQVARLPEALAQAVGGLAALAPAERQARVAALEAADPALFRDAQKAVYLTYYEQPEVVAAIRAMGITYHDTLLPQGYDLPPFDPLIDAPRHGRGRFVATADVARLPTVGA